MQSSSAEVAGLRCLPVASCDMFRNGDAGLCALVHEDGHVDLPASIAARPGSFGIVERVCEGAPGDQEGLKGCLDFVETQLHCTYRVPNLPNYRCGFVDGMCNNLRAHP